MRKRIIGLILIFSIIMVGCTSKTSENLSSASQALEMAQSDSSVSTEMYDMDSGATEESSVNGEKLLEPERKIIKSSQLSLETAKFNDVINSLEDMVKSYGGYIASSSIDAEGINNNYQCLRFASYKINVPSDKLDDFLDESSKLATVRNKSTSAEDITAQYYDNESRLKSLQIQEERYLEILKTATEVKDIIEIENALTDVRYEIENLTTCLNKISNLVDMATVNINIQEVSQETVTQSVPKTLGEKISSSFVNSLKKIKEFSINTVIFIIAAIPYLIIISILLVLSLGIYKAIKNKKSK
ncbi:DUF4349 domain-containing protein [uncultured Clostridium sp.]|uniref:DUF4349 domain-containing protein n=1 Tax=uncultured Clostridium sp. TaxID=59620 RepID=UPI0026734C52|nr:DUF4349 domain-containing protein [uncultured Clostridium sp.]